MKKVIIVILFLLIASELLLFDRFGIIHRVRQLLISFDDSISIRRFTNNVNFLLFSYLLFSFFYLLRLLKIHLSFKFLNLALIGLVLRNSNDLRFFTIDWAQFSSSGRLYLYLTILSFINFSLFSIFKFFKGEESFNVLSVKPVIFDTLAIVSIFSIVFAGQHSFEFGIYADWLLERFSFNLVSFFNGYFFTLSFLILVGFLEINQDSIPSLNVFRSIIIVFILTLANQQNSNDYVFFVLNSGLWLLLIIHFSNLKHSQLLSE